MVAGEGWAIRGDRGRAGVGDEGAAPVIPGSEQQHSAFGIGESGKLVGKVCAVRPVCCYCPGCNTV